MLYVLNIVVKTFRVYLIVYTFIKGLFSAQNKKIIITNWCFDLLIKVHININGNIPFPANYSKKIEVSIFYCNRCLLVLINLNYGLHYYTVCMNFEFFHKSINFSMCSQNIFYLGLSGWNICPKSYLVIF